MVWQRAVEVRPGLGVDGDDVGAGLGEGGEKRIGRRDHQVDVERLRRAWRGCAATTGGPKVMLGTKWPSMTSTWIQSAPAASIALDLLAEPGEVGGEDRGGDQGPASHRRGLSC